MTTVAIAALVLARDDVADADVINFLTAVFDNLDEITEAHAKGADLDLAYAAECGLPYHPGAAKYFEEQGITVTVK